MNTDCISRQAVIDSLYDWSNHSMTDAETWHLRQVIGDIKSMPSVTPQLSSGLDKNSKKLEGHWIKVTNGRGGHECDVCHDYAPSFQNGNEYLSAFCPNCGCAMVEPQESEETETWNGIHAQITAPKGTFDRIFNDADDDDNDI